MRKVLLLAFVMTLLLAATPAYAVSSITNYFSASDYSVSTGQSIKIYPKTVAGHMAGIPTNPYPTNFMAEVRATHFNKPVPYSTSGLPNPSSWAYVSTGDYVSPSYHYYSGELWVFTPRTLYNYCNATIKSASAGSRYGSRHGQRIAGTGASYGDAVWIYTTHN